MAGKSDHQVAPAAADTYFVRRDHLGMQSFAAPPVSHAIVAFGTEVSKPYHPRVADIGELEQPAGFHLDDVATLTAKSSGLTSRPVLNISQSGPLQAANLGRVQQPSDFTAPSVNSVESRHHSSHFGAQSSFVSPTNNRRDTWEDSVMADTSPRTDTSTDIDTDDKGNQKMEMVQHGGNSGDRSNNKSGDQKTLRRLAQNREAARKSRLRKKQYVQQLESSRLKLTQLEQELQRARQQGIFIAGGVSGDQSHSIGGNGALAFDMEYARSVADSVKDITRYTLMTTLPIDEKSASEHPVSEYALTKENVLESNSMASENIAHEVLGDKDRITTDLEKSSELQHLVKHADDTMVVKLVSKYALAKENVLESNFMPSRNVADEALGDKDRITTKLEKSTGLRRLLKNADDTMVVKLVSEYAPDKENVLESNNMPSANVADEALGDKDRITTNLEKSARLQCLVKNADDTNGGEVGSLEDKLGMSRSSEVELEELIESNEKIFSDGELTSDISVSATNSDPQCLVDDSANISQTSSSSNVELEEIVESSEATVFSNGGGDSSVSVLASNTDDQCLGEDSAYNSRASDVTFFYGGEDAAISASKQLSEDFNALSKIVDDVSYHHADLTSDSSKRLTESFFTAAETSMVDEELVESTDKDSNLYSQEESRLCAQTQYAEETNGQENDDKFIDTDGNEFIANTTSETSQRGVGFHIDVLWAQAIDSGRVLLLDKSALDPDIVHEKAISFAKNAPLGPFFKRRFSHKKVVKKPWKKNSLVKTNESEGQKSAQRNLNNGRGEISHSSDDLPSGGLPIDELARLLAQ